MMILSSLVINQLTVFYLAEKYSNYIPILSVLKPNKIDISLQWFEIIKELQTNQVGNFFDSLTALPQGQSGQAIKKIQNLNCVRNSKKFANWILEKCFILMSWSFQSIGCIILFAETKNIFLF